MIRLLVAIAAVGLAGTVGFPPPASMWFGWIGTTAGLALVFIVIAAVLQWLTPSEAHLDARRRNAAR